MNLDVEEIDAMKDKTGISGISGTNGTNGTSGISGISGINVNNNIADVIRMMDYGLSY